MWVCKECGCEIKIKVYIDGEFLSRITKDGSMKDLDKVDLKKFIVMTKYHCDNCEIDIYEIGSEREDKLEDIAVWRGE